MCRSNQGRRGPINGGQTKIRLNFKGLPKTAAQAASIFIQTHRFMTAQPSFARWLAWGGVALVAALLVWVLAPVLSPFIVAAVLAYALQPVVKKLQGLGLPRWLAAVVVECVALLALLGLLMLLVPVLLKEVPQIQQQLPLILDRMGATLEHWLGQFGLPGVPDLAQLKAQLLTYLNDNRQDWLKPLLSSLKVGGSAALAVVGHVVLVPVALFFLLKDWPRLSEQVHLLIPPVWRPTLDGLLGEVDQVLGQYLRGQLSVMVILALYYALGLRLFGLELAWPIGVFTGLAMFVPYLGFGTGLVLALMAGVLQMPVPDALTMVAVVYGSGQLMEGFFLTPRLVGERVGLHPLAVIFALLAFGQLLGFVGVLVALPVSAVLLVALRRLRARYLRSPLYHAPHDDHGSGRA